MSAAVVAVAALADALAGDPAWFPHPVRGFGYACERGERFARRFTRGEPARELVAGGALAFALVAGTYALSRGALLALERRDARAAFAVAALLGWTTLAARGLLAESDAVREALEANDLPAARARVARIVGRDTAALDAGEIARATIETLAESACDGIVAPLAALALGGVPLALAFKALSTLDSMIGHIEAPYTYFGRVAARGDDVAAYLPARLCALAIALAAPVAGGSSVRALHTWRADGDRHASPNAGQSEAAMAGALGVRLGGRNVYDGVVRDAPLLGARFAAPGAADVRRAQRIVLAVAATSVALAILARGGADRLRAAHAPDAR